MSSSRNLRKRKSTSTEDPAESDEAVDETIDLSRRYNKRHRGNTTDSDSESDSSIEVAYRRTVYRELSEAGASSSGSCTCSKCSNAESSSSEESKAGLSRTDVTETGLIYSQAENSSSDENEVDPINSTFDTYTDSTITEASNNDKSTEVCLKVDSPSESDDDELEKCAICFSPFKSQEVGSPNTCDHLFCLKCILVWSNKSGTCAVDRKIFHAILVRSSYRGKVTRLMRIKNYCECCELLDFFVPRRNGLWVCPNCDMPCDDYYNSGK